MIMAIWIIIAIIILATVAWISGLNAYVEGYLNGWIDGDDGVPCNPHKPHGHPDPDLMP